MIATPLDHFQRFQQKDEIKAQFSEDIRHVINGGYGKGSSARGDSVGTRSSRAGVRNHSPGLAAGAALALGSTARQPSQDAYNAAREIKERARGQGCPWDDHSAFRREGSTGSLGFGAGLGSEEPRGRGGTAARGGTPTRSMTPSRRPPNLQEAYDAAGAAARSLGKQNRDQQTRIFSAAPFDAPEAAMPSSTYAAASEALVAGPRGGKTVLPSGRTVPEGAPDQMHSYTDAKREAVSNRTRMAGMDGLISGNYLLGEGKTAIPVGRSGKPPPVGGLMPQAQLKAQLDGLGRPSEERAAYLNAQVMSEACRERNTAPRMHFC